MAFEEKIYSDSSDVNRRLAELGLEEEFLIRAVQRGLSAWASCGPNHPPVSRGFWAWAEAVCGLREEVIPHSWGISNEGNLPLTVNPAGTLAISVNTGDEDTGHKEGAPCTRSVKGPRTRLAVLENRGQMTLFIDEQLPPAELVNSHGRATWILLMYVDKTAMEVRCELSRPISMAPEGYVDMWAERIILKATPFGDNVISLTSGDGPKSPEIDVEIKKRG